LFVEPDDLQKDIHLSLGSSADVASARDSVAAAWFAATFLGYQASYLRRAA
jgi:hypothetical protein